MGDHSYPVRSNYYSPARWGVNLTLIVTLLTGVPLFAAPAKEKKPVSADAPTVAIASKPVSNTVLQKTRGEFQKLGLEMVSMTSVGGENVAYLKYRGGDSPVMCTVGQIIGGFKIISVQNNYTVFEGNGVRLWLALGEDDSEASADLAAEEVDDSIEVKEPDAGVKTKTRSFGRVPLVDSIIKPKSRPAAKSSKINITAKERIVYNGKVVDVASLGSEGATKEKPGRFVMPVNGSLSSSFGYRKQPIGGARKYHQGVDIQAPIRSPIVASASGTVIEVSRSWAKGLNLLIKHSGGYETAYFHLSSATVKEGQKVNQGQLIGYEGMTGVTTGPHVHFEIHKDGQPLDPALFIKELAN